VENTLVEAKEQGTIILGIDVAVNSEEMTRASITVARVNGDVVEILDIRQTTIQERFTEILIELTEKYPASNWFKETHQEK
jgi:hypothetical protein